MNESFDIRLINYPYDITDYELKLHNFISCQWEGFTFNEVIIHLLR